MKVGNLKQKFFLLVIFLIISVGLVHSAEQGKAKVESPRANVEKKVAKENAEQATANKEKPAVEYKIEDVNFVADCDGIEQKYVIMTPDVNLVAQVHDLIIILHGHGSDRWQFVKEPYEQCRAIRDVAMEHKMIFVSPDYRATTSWMGPQAEQDILQIIANLKKKYCIGKVFIGGGSMGGSSCLTFTAIHPELIDGVCSLNGTANHLEYQNFQEAINNSFGGTKTEIPLEYKKRSAEYWPERFTMPVGIAVSGQDTIVPPDSVLRLANTLKLMERDVMVIYDEGFGHDTKYENARAVWEFVIQKARERDASGMPVDDKTVPLTGLLMFHSQQEWGVVGYNEAAHPLHPLDVNALGLKINDKTFSEGIGTHANGSIIYCLDGKYKTFDAEVGVQWQGGGNSASVIFQVFVDGEKRFDSGSMSETDLPKKVHILVSGADKIKLVTMPGSRNIHFGLDLGNWVDAYVTLSDKPLPNKMIDVGVFGKVMTWEPDDLELKWERSSVLETEQIFSGRQLRENADKSYPLPVCSNGQKCIGFQWAENRLLDTLCIEFDGLTRAEDDDVLVQLWMGHSVYQGKWETLSGKLVREKNGYTFYATIKDQVKRSQPDAWINYVVPGTQKVRWIFGPSFKAFAVKKLEAYGASKWVPVSLRFQAEKSNKKEIAKIELYNGKILKADNKISDITCDWNTKKPKKMKLLYDKENRHPTTVRIQLGEDAFGVSVSDVFEKGCVYVQDAGLLVTPASSELTIDNYTNKIKDRKTVLERVRQMPDQSFTQAMNKIHKPNSNTGPTMLSLACSNEKFIVTEAGQIDYFSENKPTLKNPEIRARKNVLKIVPTFGTDKGLKKDRYLLKDYLPIPVTAIEENGIEYQLLSFVSPYGEIMSECHPWLNRKSLFVTEVQVYNKLDKTADIYIKYLFEDIKNDIKSYDYVSDIEYNDKEEAVLEKVSNGIVVKSGDTLLAYVDTSGLSSFSLDLNGGQLELKGSLAAKSQKSLLIYIPSWSMKSSEFVSLKGGNRLITDVETYWISILDEGLQSNIPNKLLNNVIKTSVINCLIATRNKENGKQFVPWICSAIYGPYESEAHAVIYGMDLMGYHDFARRSLDFFIDLYSPQGYLTTGYTLMGMGQHLWTLGEHFQLCQDRKWLKGHAPKIAKACEWTMSQREKTKKLDAYGEKLPEYSLFPPGLAADWHRFCYRATLQGYFYGGLNNAAYSLGQIDYPGADVFLANAKDFREQIRRAYFWTQARSPVLQLIDGTSVPYCPSATYCFGKVGDIYRNEDVGRAWSYDVELGSHYLVPLGVIDSNEKNVEWMTEQLEDVFFLDPGKISGYTQKELDNDWFDLGGFSKVQPYYTKIAQIYAMTDDVKPFIRSYFNALPTLLNTENLSLWEHFHGTGGWNKTHETGCFLRQSRTMFVMERDNELWLAPFITTHWMKDGMEVNVKNADTRFGSISYDIISSVKKGFIEATIEPHLRLDPKNIFIRLRHPDGKSIQKVTVNGVVCSDFNIEKEYIELGKLKGATVIRAEY